MTAIAAVESHITSTRITEVRVTISNVHETIRADIALFDRSVVMASAALRDYFQDRRVEDLEYANFMAARAKAAFGRISDKLPACGCAEPSMMVEVEQAATNWSDAYAAALVNGDIESLAPLLGESLRASNSLGFRLQVAQTALRQPAAELGRRSDRLHALAIMTLAITLIAAFIVTARIRDVYHEAELSRVKAAEASEDKVRFVRGVTHDIKNPLGAAMMLVQALRRYSTLDEKATGTLKLAEQGIRSALYTVETLLDLTCAEANTLHINPTPTSMPQLVNSVADMHAPAIEEAGLTITTKVPDCDCLETVDRKRVQQVLDNLMSNAIKYTPAGGNVDLAVRRAGDWLRISVTDTGRGMSANEMALIFDEFYRRTEHAEIQGSGLGLAISRKLA